MLKTLPECRVKIELESTRNKSRRPVPAAPANSIESEDLTGGGEGDDMRLSQPATNQNIQLGLPGDEVTGATLM